MSDEPKEPADHEEPAPEADHEGSEPEESVDPEAEPDREPASEPEPLVPTTPTDVSASGEFVPVTFRDRVMWTFQQPGSGFPGLSKEFVFPAATLVALFVIFLSFRSVLLPFILACALVYVMEPVVARVSKGPKRTKGLPRWAAVILVYVLFLSSVSMFSIFVVPRFVSEIVRFAETVPTMVQDFRAESLPTLNEDVQEFLRQYLPLKADETPNGSGAAAHAAVREARLVAARRATAQGVALAHVRHASQVEIVWAMEMVEAEAVRNIVVNRPETPVPAFGLADATRSRGWRFASENDAALTLEPTDDGAMRVYLNDVALQVEEVDDHKWVVTRRAREELPKESDTAIEDILNLERTVDGIIENFLTSSQTQLTSAVTFVQKLVVGVVGAFVAIVLTLMVAAFISIDLHRVLGFFRGLVPTEGRRGYDILLAKLDRGLAGVIRGQLFICLINGFLTWLGLAILGVKFSVLLGVVAGILSLIPVFGTVLSTVPIVLIGLTDGLSTGALALGWILLIHFIEANMLNPKIIGSSAHIHPVIVIFALLAGESAYGLVGALLAVPTASILLTLFDFVRTKAWREGAEPLEGV